MPKVIDKFYNAGLTAFGEGKTILHVAETMDKIKHPAPDAPPPNFEEKENQMFSYRIGFMDGVLKKVRSLR